MKPSAAKRNPLLQAWAALLVLTCVSLLLGEKFGHASWMPVPVAAIIWLKGTVVARCFLESRTVHPFIAWLLRAFVAFAPVALLTTAWL